MPCVCAEYHAAQLLAGAQQCLYVVLIDVVVHTFIVNQHEIAAMH